MSGLIMPVTSLSISTNNGAGARSGETDQGGNQGKRKDELESKFEQDEVISKRRKYLEGESEKVLQRIIDDDTYVSMKTLKDDSEIKNFYKKIEKLGEGNFSETYEVRNTINLQEKLSMKVQKKQAVALGVDVSARELFRLYKKLLILSRILPRHENIIEVKDILVSKSSIYILTELCARDITLQDFFRKSDNSSGRRVFKQIAEAVRFMHQHGVVHLDLKPDNILFTDTDFLECKIIDFGTSEYVPKLAKQIHKGFRADTWFSAEELKNASEEGKPIMDIQSLGKLLLSILAGRCIPFALPPCQLAEALVDFKPREKVFPEVAMNLLRWIGPPPFGPSKDEYFATIDQICEHPWLSQEEGFREVNRRLSTMQNDITLLADLLINVGQVAPKVLKDDSEIEKYYQKLGSLQKDTTTPRTFECKDVSNEAVKLAMKIVAGSNLTKPGVDKAESFRLYTSVLIPMKILPRHENVIEVKDVLLSKESLYIITELSEKYTLDDFIPFAKTGARRVFKQIAETVRFMHRYGVVHMNLNPHNIVFMDSRFQKIKIIDFGQSAYVPELATLCNDGFDASSRKWFTPESLVIASKDGRVEVDIRGLGRILHAIMSGTWVSDPAGYEVYKPRKEFFDKNAIDLLKKIGPIPFGPKTDMELITMDEICCHPWLQAKDDYMDESSFRGNIPDIQKECTEYRYFVDFPYINLKKKNGNKAWKEAM